MQDASVEGGRVNDARRIVFAILRAVWEVETYNRARYSWKGYCGC